MAISGGRRRSRPPRNRRAPRAAERPNRPRCGVRRRALPPREGASRTPRPQSPFRRSAEAEGSLPATKRCGGPRPPHPAAGRPRSSSLLSPRPRRPALLRGRIRPGSPHAAVPQPLPFPQPEPSPRLPSPCRPPPAPRPSPPRGSPNGRSPHPAPGEGVLRHHRRRRTFSPGRAALVPPAAGGAPPHLPPLPAHTAPGTHRRSGVGETEAPVPARPAPLHLRAQRPCRPRMDYGGRALPRAGLRDHPGGPGLEEGEGEEEEEREALRPAGRRGGGPQGRAGLRRGGSAAAATCCWAGCGSAGTALLPAGLLLSSVVVRTSRFTPPGGCPSSLTKLSPLLGLESMFFLQSDFVSEPSDSSVRQDAPLLVP